MAFRFQRRIRIMPGVRLNVSKSGLGASLGFPGASLSVGSTGVHSHAGIPGTGLAYRKKLNSNHSNNISSRGSRALSSGKYLEEFLRSGGQFELGVSINEDAEITFNEIGGEPLDDDEVKTLKRLVPEKLRELLQREIDRSNNVIFSIKSTFQDTPNPNKKFQFIRREFSEPKPVMPELIKKSLFSLIWPPRSKDIDANNAELMDEFAKKTNDWESKKLKFEADEDARLKCETESVLRDVHSMEQVLEKHLSEIDWPVETQIDFDFGNDFRTLAVDIQLPEEDNMPKFEWSMTASQIRISKRAISVSQRRTIYRDYIHAVVFRVLGEVFYRLPSVKIAMISCYIEGIKKANGHNEDQYLVSVIVKRDEWIKLNFDRLNNIDPYECLGGFSTRRSFTKTAVCSSIAPFTEADMNQMLS